MNRSTLFSGAARRLSLTMVGILCLTLIAPMATQANTDIELGGTGTVSSTDGGFVLLRAKPGWDAAVLTSLPEGTVVDILDGPLYDGGGSPWYAVVARGQEGFLPAAFLTGDGGGEASGGGTPSGGDASAAAPATNFVAATGETAVIAGTNYDGARCRSEPSYAGGVITVLAEGAAVALNGVATGEWQPVVCAGAAGYVHVDFVLIGGAVPAPPALAPAALPTEQAVEQPAPLAESQPVAVGASTAATTGYAVVVGTNGDGVRCRSAAGYDASIITVLPEGAEVALSGAPVGVWQPVVCAGASGYVHGDFLSTAGAAAPVEEPAAPAEATSIGAQAATGSAMVTGTNGGGLRCRTGAGYDASIITVLAEGASVSLTGAAQGEWQPVLCAGANGFVHVDYLAYGGESGSDGGSDDGGSNDGGSSGGGAVSGSATVSGTGGGGLRCRSGAGYDAGILVVLPEGTSVSLRGAAQGEWQPVVCAGSNGFVHVDYLAYGGGESGGNDGGDDGGSDGGGSGGLAVGSNAMTMANLNLRYEASFSAGVAAVAPSGTVVAITGGPTNGFYQVDWDGLGGWMHGDYLNWTDQPLSERGGSGDPGPAPGGGNGGTPGGGAGTATGQAIADFALQYVGYPYVWAGAGPYGFDCSGLTMYVIKQVLGLDITHDMFIQYDLGTPVAYSDLQPGDLVFFQNTFRWGMSHNGIYIGNGQMVHAENEQTGVKISDINSEYYSSRYYGAVRFA